MTRSATTAVLVLLVAGLIGVDPGQAGPAPWKPARSITIIVPWAAGGSTDMTARIMASQMEKPLGQKIVIINSPGAGGAIGMKEVWDRPRDGYTWTANSSTAAISYAVLGQLDLTHRDWLYFYSLYAPNVIAVRADSPIKDVKGLVDAMKARPGAVTVSSAGAGSSGHLAAETFRLAAGTTYRHIAYAGGAPAVVAAVAGEVEVVMQLSMEAAEMLRAKRLRALAVMSSTPLELDGYGIIPAITAFIPTFPETGSYFGVMVPKDLPAAVVAAVDEAFLYAADTFTLRSFAKHMGTAHASLSGKRASDVTEAKARRVAWTLFDAGLAKRSPADLGIPKP
ncbi:MAG: tripartite tricarboxylate transporter substrate binding protein [Armatimonadetes bacterium]|nr:tripartite tricarboxylate transporter substrate binding protein [Armatimonadota bacterium]